MVKQDTRKLEAILRNLKRNTDEANKQIAEDIADDAQANAPVDTGELRASIHTEKTDNGLAVVVGAAYGAFVELGTSKMAAQPYLGPAAAKARHNQAKYYEKVVTDD